MQDRLDKKWLELLTGNTSPLLLTQIVPDSRIVIGCPHHASKGLPRMLCDRNADENAGYLACYLAKKLNCSLIIANRYFFDPNKSVGSDYFCFIKNLHPELLIEIHGHGNRSANYDVEISSGPFQPEYARDFAEKLSSLTAQDKHLDHYSISGDYNKIYFTAQFSVTITDKRWNSLHIELPPDLRKSNDSLIPPEKGFLFMDYIAESLL